MRNFSTIGLLMPALAAPLAVASETQATARQNGATVSWSLTTIIGAVITITAAAVLIWVVRRIFFRRKQGPLNDPRQLLRELCKAHGLSRRAERLISKAAATLETPHPGRFFLEPQLLLQAQSLEKMRSQKRALELLHDRLFGDEGA